MAGAMQPPAARAGVSFEPEQVEVEAGRVVVTGHWYGVRGLRFVRPTLVADGREVLATLEHKPWAPDTGDVWTAAFPWDGPDIAVDQAALAVAPSVVVPLAPNAEGGVAVPVDEPVEVSAAPAPAETVDVSRLDRLRAEIGELRRRLGAVAEERDELRARVEQAEARAEALAEAARRERRVADDVSVGRDELQQARAAAERERDHALAQRHEAIADREAAMRSRRRMQEERDEAAAALEAVEQDRERALAAVQDERDCALAQRDDARAQREEVLVAHRAVERQLNRERAAEPRFERSLEVPARAERTPALPADRDAEHEEPIGVRAIPAARPVAPRLRAGDPDFRTYLTKYDLYAIRFFGTIAALAFVLLLVMFLRLFI